MSTLADLRDALASFLTPRSSREERYGRGPNAGETSPWPHTPS
jgi:hypothetical protein